ncbi:MAG: universal stress protein [Deltaproteobacteria bacterium]|nr:MAG: universal stress protein [Deltaproteobacteria bacterium]
MIETILVATDGSEAAADAEAFATALAARLKVRLQAIFVLEDRYMHPRRDEGLGVPTPPHEAVAEYLKARADAAGRRLRERAGSAGVEIACEIVQGVADDLIVERGRSAGLLVLGRDGENARFHTALIGSTVDGVLRKTSKPVIVVPSGAPRLGSILLAFDGSPGSRLAANLTVDLGRRLEVPVHVFVDSKDKGRAVARFEEARRRLAGLGTPIREASSTLGRPDVKIIDAARDADVGLIIMGAFGRSRITEYFLGSNSAAVVRNSPIAVLLAH